MGEMWEFFPNSLRQNKIYNQACMDINCNILLVYVFGPAQNIYIWYNNKKDNNTIQNWYEQNEERCVYQKCITIT